MVPMIEMPVPIRVAIITAIGLLVYLAVCRSGIRHVMMTPVVMICLSVIMMITVMMIFHVMVSIMMTAATPMMPASAAMATALGIGHWGDGETG